MNHHSISSSDTKREGLVNPFNSHDLPSATHSNRVAMGKTIAKIFLCLLSMSMSLFAIVGGSIPLSACGIVGLIVLSKPLFNNVKTAIIGANKSPNKRIQSTAGWIASVCGHIGIVYAISRKLLTNTNPAIGFACSSLPIGGALLMTAIILSDQSKEARDSAENARLITACRRLQDKIADLRARTKQIDDFINDRLDLKKIVEEHLQKYSEYIARGEHLHNVVVEGPDDWIGRRGALSIEVTVLEHFLTERELFIKRHSEVYDCFQKHVLAMQDDQGDVGTKSMDATIERLGNTQIEEINDDST